MTTHARTAERLVAFVLDGILMGVGTPRELRELVSEGALPEETTHREIVPADLG